MRTLFIGAYGFGNLGDETCLMEALAAFESKEKWVRTVSKEYTSKFVTCDGFIDWDPARPDKNFKVPFERVVLGGGGLLNCAPGADYMHWIIAAQRSGAKTYIHNVGASENLDDFNWMTDEIKKAFEKLDGFSARDEYSIGRLKGCGIKKEISLVKFPEKNIQKDMSLAALLPKGNILGISVTNEEVLWKALIKNNNLIKEFINQYRGYKILPIISVVHLFSQTENDIEAFKKFHEMFLKDFEILLPKTLDKEWWHENMSPQRLKGLISSCDTLLSRRKHNCVHGISSGVKTVGISLPENLGTATVFESLKDELPEGSGLITLN